MGRNVLRMRPPEHASVSLTWNFNNEFFGLQHIEFEMKYNLIYPSDPLKLAVEENTEAKLSFPEPGSGGPYEEITWYKERTGSSNYRIVFLHSDIAEGKPRYYNDYCSARSPCYSSSKGILNSITGTFTIYNTQIYDEGFYYYDSYRGNGSPDTGHKYEITLEVYGEFMLHHGEHYL